MRYLRLRDEGELIEKMCKERSLGESLVSERGVRTHDSRGGGARRALKNFGGQGKLSSGLISPTSQWTERGV